MLADRQIQKDFYDEWSSRHYEASTSMEDREDKLNAIYEEIESNLILVGVTAIEDKLQDGVSQTISKLQTAGIKMWMLTGDKQGTRRISITPMHLKDLKKTVAPDFIELFL